MIMTPKTILVILAIVMAALSYVYGPLLGASVILLGVTHFVP